MVVRPKNYRRMALWSGMVSLPNSFLDLIYFGSYWSPIKLGNWRIGIEDLIFNFYTGTWVCLAASWPFRSRLSISKNPHFSIFWRRYFFTVLVFIGMSLVIRLTGISSLENSLMAGVLTLFVLLLKQPSLRVLALTGVLCFTPVYILVVKTQLLLWPDYLLQWNLEGPLGARFWGIPLGEIIYSIVFGATWPSFIGFFFDIRPAKMS